VRRWASADLDSRLAGEEPAERKEEVWPELHQHYAAEFGVDPEVGRRAMEEYKDSA
jgi:hypothetical protein